MEDKKRLLADVRLFVLDMDGTFYLGDRILEGSLEFLQKIRETQRDFLFLTNNSSKSPSIYIEKLAKMGCFINSSQIMTSGDVTIEYLKVNHPGKKVYLVGTPALEQTFQEAGIPLTQEMPDIVVVGFDLTLTYEKLERACTYIRRGAVFLATHLDINCPTEDGFIPDCGAFCAAISLSTGVQPQYLGKPLPETVEMVLRRTGRRKEEIAFVGDRLYTDVAAGVNNGAKGILVLTGETQLSDVASSPVQPHGIFDSLLEISQHL